MAEAEGLMRPIDSYTVGEAVDPETMRSAAATIAPLMLATPHLFPPTTNLYDEAADIPVTIAMPAIWMDFATFTALAEAAVSAADALGSAGDATSLEAGATRLRAACDACHALYMLPYEPPSITDDDLNFDFDGFFDEIE